jgi:hypothetical protein
MIIMEGERGLLGLWGVESTRDLGRSMSASVFGLRLGKPRLQCWWGTAFERFLREADVGRKEVAEDRARLPHYDPVPP